MSGVPRAVNIEVEMVLIPAGPFHFGEDGELRYLPPFRIGRFPVTVESYAGFLEGTGHHEPRDWKAMSAPRRRRHPVTGVTFFDALAFAEWLGHDLPTEEQWEKAARGTDERRYPWGQEFNVRNLNSRGAKKRDTTAVGRYPSGVSPFGVEDMAGNVWEWTDSWFDENDDLKVLKGGCHTLTKQYATVSYRHFNDPGFANTLTGFRTVEAL
jgi:formylglycine-generating enzyme required for sulfatase activity